MNRRQATVSALQYPSKIFCSIFMNRSEVTVSVLQYPSKIFCSIFMNRSEQICSSTNSCTSYVAQAELQAKLHKSYAKVLYNIAEDIHILYMHIAQPLQHNKINKLMHKLSISSSVAQAVSQTRGTTYSKITVAQVL